VLCRGQALLFFNQISLALLYSMLRSGDEAVAAARDEHSWKYEMLF
jgi:hypothetical protein